MTGCLATLKPIFPMGFDQNENRPIVNFRKWTTKVNVWIIIGVLIFLAAGGAGIWVMTLLKSKT